MSQFPFPCTHCTIAEAERKEIQILLIVTEIQNTTVKNQRTSISSIKHRAER